jgi:hypothetical protein
MGWLWFLICIVVYALIGLLACITWVYFYPDKENSNSPSISRGFLFITICFGPVVLLVVLICAGLRGFTKFLDKVEKIGRKRY